MSAAFAVTPGADTAPRVNYFEPTRGTSAVNRFEIMLSTGETVVVDGADAYQPEGPLTTFFTTGSSRQTIDSWSVRLASFRTADIVAVRRAIDLRVAPPQLTVVA